MLFNNIHCETISKFDVVVVLLLVILENHILLQKRRLPNVAWDLRKKPERNETLPSYKRKMGVWRLIGNRLFM